MIKYGKLRCIIIKEGGQVELMDLRVYLIGSCRLQLCKFAGSINST